TAARGRPTQSHPFPLAPDRRRDSPHHPGSLPVPGPREPVPRPRGDPPVRLSGKDAPMATEGLFALLCAGALVAAGPTGNAAPPANGDREAAVNDTLAVQTALQQAKELLGRSRFREAVYVLEKELPRINGSRTYLNTLQDAYRGYVKELRLAKQ